MNIKSQSSSNLLKTFATQEVLKLPDKYRKMLVDLMKYYYDKGQYTDDDIALAVRAGNILPEDYTYITGKPYPADSLIGSTGSNGSDGSNPSK